LLGVGDKISEWCPVEAKKIPVFRAQIPVSGLTGICLQAVDMLHQNGPAARRDTGFNQPDFPVFAPQREFFPAETSPISTGSTASQCGLQHYLQQDEPIPLARVAPAFPFEERKA
jgi:hypothetical protein